MRPSLRFLGLVMVGWVGLRSVMLGAIPGGEMFRLKAKPAVIQMPIGSESDYLGLIDLLNMVAYIYHDDLGQNIEQTEIPANLMEEATTRRATLVEAIAETDEDDGPQPNVTTSSGWLTPSRLSSCCSMPEPFSVASAIRKP